MAGHASTLADVAVRRALAACQRVDPQTRLSSVTTDDDEQLRLRFRTGDAHTMPTLRVALQREMPFARTYIVESLIDGFMEISLVVPRREVERRAVRVFVTRRRCFAYWILLFWLLVFVAASEWYTSVVGGDAPPLPSDAI